MSARQSRDVGTTPRARLSDSDKLALYEAQQGICPLCTREMRTGQKLVDEHLTPLGLGGANALTNRAIVHLACAEVKTHGPTGDIARIADAKRVKRKSLGFHTPHRPMPCGKASPFKRLIGGRTVLRETGEPV